MAPDPYRYFRVEARELLDQLGKGILELEKAEEGGHLVQKLLRLAHTLKGAARVVKQLEIASAAHAVEEVLQPHRGAGAPVPREVCNRLLELADRIGGHLAALAQAPAPEAAPAASGAARKGPDPAPVERSLQTLRTDVADVDALLEGLAETHVLLGALRRATGPAEQARHLAELLADQLGARGSRDPRAASMAEDLRDLCGGLERSAGAAVEQ